MKCKTQCLIHSMSKFSQKHQHLYMWRKTLLNQKRSVSLVSHLFTHPLTSSAELWTRPGYKHPQRRTYYKTSNIIINLWIHKDLSLTSFKKEMIVFVLRLASRTRRVAVTPPRSPSPDCRRTPRTYSGSRLWLASRPETAGVMWLMKADDKVVI